MTQRSTTERWLTVPEAAAALGVSTDMVYRMAQKGELNRRKIGSAVRIDPASALPDGVAIPRVDKPVDLAPLLRQMDLALEMFQQARAQLETALQREGR